MTLNPLLWIEGAFQKIYGSRWNPTHQSGVLALFFALVAVLSGIVMLFFYAVDNPYGSAAATPTWLRTLHRYSSDAAVIAVVVHMLKMFSQKRAFGPRARAWISGLVLTALMLFIGETGLIMAWDSLAQRLALASVRFVELFPLFSEPPRRIFADEANLGTAFFFMLMFLHVALPLVMAFLLWFHTSRVARAVYLPERAVCLFWAGVLLVLALVWPAALGPRADLQALPGETVFDVWYAFWLPLEERFGGPLTMLGFAGVFLLLASYAFTGRAGEPSHVDERLCDGCTQCFQDCPYEAIQMVPRTEYLDGRHSPLVAHVNPDLCVSCGICAASCKPMGVGPPDRTGREQLRAMEEVLSKQPLGGDEVAVLACSSGCGLSPALRGLPGVRLFNTDCSGSVHTSVMELMLRRGALGVMVVSCPQRDCTNREGPKWLDLRVFHDREAELMERVDRRRVRLSEGSRAQGREVALQAAAFLLEVRALEQPAPLPDEEKICDPPLAV